MKLLFNVSVEDVIKKYQDQWITYKEVLEQHMTMNADYAFTQVPLQAAYIENITALFHKKQKLKPHMIIVIGIGGSNLGCMALQQALYGDFYNEKSAIKIYYADTVDADYIADIAQIAEHSLQQGKEVLLNVITKSGQTTETIANFQIFLALIKKYKKNVQENIIITTDKDSPLAIYAQQEGFDFLTIPHAVGGRYSVFTAVGIFPLLFLGVNIEQLLKGAQQASQDFLNQSLADSISALRASIIAYMYSQSIMIHDMFVFSKNLQMYSYWYRQLMAESIGKEFDNDGNKVEIGITPTVSVGSTDLHSVAQLYLSDDIERFTTFITVKQSRESVVVPDNRDLNAIVADISGKDLAELMDIISLGVQKAYAKKGRPFCTITLEKLDEYNLGYLMQSNMLEIAMVGFLLNIDPFNQPNVELYKVEVRDMLRRKNG